MGIIYITISFIKAKSVTSALILSVNAKNQLKNSPVKTVDVNIEFQSGQDSVTFWMIDGQGNKKSTLLRKKDGKVNSESPNERSFQIYFGSFPSLNQESISEIRIEARGLKGSTCSFAIKSLVLK